MPDALFFRMANTEATASTVAYAQQAPGRRGRGGGAREKGEGEGVEEGGASRSEGGGSQHTWLGMT